MSKNKLKELANRKNELIRNIHAYSEKKRYLVKTLEELNRQYHSELISHERYRHNLHSILKDRTLDQHIRHYNNAIEHYRKQLHICERGLEKESSKAEIRSKAIPLLIVIGILIALGFGLRYIEPTITGATVAEIGVTIDGATSFKAEENPSFEIKIDKGNLITGFAIGASRDEFNASLITPSGKEIKLKDEIKRTAKGFNIELKNDRSFAPGLYKLRIKTINGITEQDFSWGVLAINVDKSIYLENEEAFIGIAVLDNLGKIVCNADVTLEIIDPNNNVEVLSIENNGIKISPECNVLGVTNMPDYYTDYKVGEKGRYLMNLTAKTSNGIRNIIDGFVVQEKVEFDVERKGPTRIYPYVPYIMNFTIKANEDYSGKIIEFVPNSFRITEQKDLEIIENGNSKILSWNKGLVKGKTYSLYYEFDALDVSPEFYLLGPLEIGKFKEIRHWQIASDQVSQNLNVTGCSGGTSCSVVNYNDNNTAIGHTIAKGATGTANWSTLNPNSAITVEDVIMHFRHAGQTGIDGVWTLTIRNKAGTFTYCTDNSIAHSASDTYVKINLTAGSCNMANTTRLNNLSMTFKNGDSAGGQNALIYYADVFVQYRTVPTIPLLNLPANNTDTSDNTPTFEWFNSTDSGGDPINYTLEVWNNSLMTEIAYRNMSIIEQGKNQTNLTLPSALLDGDYFWRVNASDGNLSSEWSLNRTLNIFSYGILDVNITYPPDEFNINKSQAFTLNGTVQCTGAGTDVRCGTVTALARYNSTGTTPDTAINDSEGGDPFFVQGTGGTSGVFMYNFSNVTSPSPLSNATRGSDASAPDSDPTIYKVGTGEYTSLMYDQVAREDDTPFVHSGSKVWSRYHIKINESKSNIINITIFALAYAVDPIEPSISLPIYLHIYNVTNSSWQELASADFTTYVNMTGSVAANANDYIDSDNYVHYLISVRATTVRYYVDYTYLNVTTSGVGSNTQSSSETLEKGETFNVTWKINITNVSGIFETNIKFNSSFGNSFVLDNYTANRTIRINVSAGAPANSAPSAPLLNVPFNNTNTSDNTPMFTWFNSTDADRNPINYTLEIWNNSAMTSIAYRNLTIIEQGKNQTNVTLPTSLLDGTYYWRVNASDGSLSSSWSLNRTLNIDTAPPNIFLIQPQNTTYTVTNLSLNFTIIDTATNETWYNLNKGQNTTIFGNTTFIANSGSNNTIFLYHRDMAGNTNVSNVSFTLSLAAGDANLRPNITFISLNSSETIIAGDKRVLNFSFIAQDQNGAIGLDNNSIIANITFTSTNINTARNATCSVSSSQVGLNSQQRNYTCGFDDVYFYDAPGSWNVAVLISDNNTADNVTMNNSQWFSIQQTISINRTVATVQFPAVNLGENNVTSSNDPNKIQNIGNKNNIIINLTAINLIGDSDSSGAAIRIDAINFTTNYITNAAKGECHYNATSGSGAGARLLNNTMISMNITILRGPNQLNDTYFCLLHVPGTILPQTYSTGGTPNEPDWTFTAG